MYPAQAFVDGIYTVHDLPDALDYSGTNAPVTLNKLNTPEQSNYFDGIAYFRGEYEFSGQQEIVDLGIQDGVWGLGDSLNDQARTTPLCLIDDFRTEDQFADTYTVSGGELGPIQVTRVSLCLWEGTDSCGNKAQLIYLEDPSNGKLWFVDVPQYGGPCVIFDVLQGEKIGLQNTPVGGYGNPPYENPVLFVS
jgi:hypothetical protein